jgi:hypothetical protein
MAIAYNRYKFVAACLRAAVSEVKQPPIWIQKWFKRPRSGLK